MKLRIKWEHMQKQESLKPQTGKSVHITYESVKKMVSVFLMLAW